MRRWDELHWNVKTSSKLRPNCLQTPSQISAKSAEIGNGKSICFFFNSFCPKNQKIVLNKLPVCLGNLSISIKSRFSTFLTNRVYWEENSEAQKIQNCQRPRKFTHFRKFRTPENLEFYKFKLKRKTIQKIQKTKKFRKLKKIRKPENWENSEFWFKVKRKHYIKFRKFRNLKKNDSENSEHSESQKIQKNQNTNLN